MATVSGARFAQVRTPESFRAWAAEEPRAAAAWLTKVARTVGTSDDFTAANAAQLGDAFEALSARSIATLQTARAGTLGWSVDEPIADAPALTGTLALENGEPVLSTPAGKFSMVNADFFQLEDNDWTKNHFLGGHDVAAFAGQVVTVKGWPEQGWAPGAAARLVVEEFAPGASPDFVSGRVVVSGDDVTVRVRPGKDVKITDPALAAQLRGWDQLGVILPGAPQKNGDTYSFSANPDGFYVLAGFASAGRVTPEGRQQVSFFGAHGRGIPGTMDRAAFDSGAPRRDRHYIFGRFVNGQLEAKGYTPYAGPWAPGKGVKAEPSAKFVEWATPIEAPPEAPFTPAPPPEVPSPESLIALSSDQRWDGYRVGQFEVKRGFGQLYPENAAKLGRPLEEEHDDGKGGAVQRFERGTMKWSPAGGIKVEEIPSRGQLVALTQEQRWAGYAMGQFDVVRGFGMVYPEYSDRLGLPLENEHGDGADGAVQRFEKGVMTWNPRDGVRAVPNA